MLMPVSPEISFVLFNRAILLELKMIVSLLTGTTPLCQLAVFDQLLSVPLPVQVFVTANALTNIIAKTTIVDNKNTIARIF